MKKDQYGKYYVYALMKKSDMKKGKNIFDHALYIGKGCGSRKDEHTKEAIRLLRENKLKSSSNKLNELANLLETGEEVSAVRISAGYLCEKDALRAESMLISLIKEYRKNRPLEEQLLNEINGYDAQSITDMDLHFLYVNSEDEELSDEADEYAIIVKTNHKDMDDIDREELVGDEVKLFGDRYLGKISVKKQLKGKSKKRPGWNPFSQWTNDEAKARACRYWRLGKERVLGWIDNDGERPRWLLACVPDGSNTVVRYAWQIDWNKPFEYYPDSNQWGIPVAEEHEMHDLLGKRLMKKNSSGKLTQVLYGQADGVKIVGIKKTEKRGEIAS